MRAVDDHQQVKKCKPPVDMENQRQATARTGILESPQEEVDNRTWKAAGDPLQKSGGRPLARAKPSHKPPWLHEVCICFIGEETWEIVCHGCKKESGDTRPLQKLW